MSICYDAAQHPLQSPQRTVLLLALSAIVAVGFGGSIGPEAGLVAVVAQCSAIVAQRMARNQREARLIGEAGNAAALAGLYGAPAAAVVEEDPDTIAAKDPDAPPLALKFLASLAGFAAFVALCKLLLPGGFGKPIAVLLILILVANMNAPGALFTGILIGYGAYRLSVRNV